MSSKKVKIYRIFTIILDIVLIYPTYLEIKSGRFIPLIILLFLNIYVFLSEDNKKKRN